MNFAILLFPDVEELDFAGPFEVFGMAAKIYKDWRVYTVAAEPVVRGFNGLNVQVEHTFESAPRADVIVVPGGAGTRPGMDDEKLIDFIRKTAAEAQWVTSVCTGAFLLHRAGLLEGKRVTTHWGSRKMLTEMGNVEVVEERYVHEGNVITAAGVSAGIDMALYLVGQIKGPEEARKVQRFIEYDPAPPYADVPVA